MKQYIIPVVIALATVLVFNIVIQKVPTSVENPVGSATGPDSFFPCETHNGLTRCTERKQFSVGSTTLASFKSPTATSTLEIGLASITTATTTATQFEWGRSPFFDATSTSLGFYNLAASVKAMVTASTSPTNTAPPTVDTPYVIPPNTYVNLKMGNNLCTAGGTCSAIGGYAVVEFVY